MTEKYAVILNGGKQYKVNVGQTLKLESLDTPTGQTIKLDSVLAISDGDNIEIGAPTINNAYVDAEIVNHGRHKKIEIIKFKRRKHYMKRAGHRQNFTEVKIVGIHS